MINLIASNITRNKVFLMQPPRKKISLHVVIVFINMKKQTKHFASYKNNNKFYIALIILTYHFTVFKR